MNRVIKKLMNLKVISIPFVGDLGEPANYKVALLDPESDKWLNAMNVEMQSMRDNEVWEIFDIPPNGKTVGHKWLFKKKTDMDGAAHTYKARLVAKGFTQTSGIDYEETFSPVAVDHMHQPWRTFAAIINRCLSGKTTDRQQRLHERRETCFSVLPPAGMTNRKMLNFTAYKTYFAFATGETTPKKAWKFKKPASLLGLKYKVKTAQLNVNAASEICLKLTTASKYQVNAANMDQDSAHMVVASKVPMLKPENGATLSKTKIVEGVMTKMPITTAEEKTQRRLEVKARSTLMMGGMDIK
ncbi:putative retrotransposon ty1-copia subclass protein [Tanacetum coccineum]